MNINAISKGITHIEDLEPAEFLKVLKNLNQYELSEKVDGAQILFGLDHHGFYTSRETKGGVRIYNEGDYDIKFSSTYIRSAHKLLEQMLPSLKGAGLRLGDQVEAEVLYGKMPNVVPYSEDINYLIFLRTTEGTVNINHLHQRLAGHVASVSLVSPFTNDGRTIELQEETNTWKFSRVPVIEKKDISTSLQVYVSEMKKFLEVTDPVTSQSYDTILKLPLNKIPDWVEPGTWKEVKEHIKEKRTYIQGMLEAGHIIPIKEVLLNYYVRNTASSFGPLLEDGGWIEGVVLRHKSSGKMVKLVDKNIFGVIREFSWQVRNNLTEAARSTEGNLSFLGNLRVSMAVALGHPALGTIQSRHYLKQAGITNEDRVSYIAQNLDVSSVKDYWGNLIEQQRCELEAKLDKYDREKAFLRVESPAQSIPIIEKQRYSNDIDRRTKEVFASIFAQLSQMQHSIAESTTAADLVYLLAGKQLGKLT